MEQERINVFVYGTLRTGQRNWQYFLQNNPNAKKVCDDKIKGFIMYHLGGFPAIVPVENVFELAEYYEGDHPEIIFDGIITGEVFSVDADTLKGLDSLEGYRGNGSGLYNRKEIKTENGHTALVYFMNQGRKNSQIIETGDWLKL